MFIFTSIRAFIKFNLFPTNVVGILKCECEIIIYNFRITQMHGNGIGGDILNFEEVKSFVEFGRTVFLPHTPNTQLCRDVLTNDLNPVASYNVTSLRKSLVF